MSVMGLRVRAAGVADVPFSQVPCSLMELQPLSPAGVRTHCVNHVGLGHMHTVKLFHSCPSVTPPGQSVN